MNSATVSAMGRELSPWASSHRTARSRMRRMSRWTALQCSVGNDAGRLFSCVHHDVQFENFTERHERLGHGNFRGRGFLHGAEREGDAAHVDHVVGHHRGDDLAPQRMGVQFGVEPFPQLRREVRAQRGPEPRIIGQVAVTQRRSQLNFRVGRQYRKLRRRQPLALARAVRCRVSVLGSASRSRFRSADFSSQSIRRS